jgi:uncharacterized membrane protein
LNLDFLPAKRNAPAGGALKDASIPLVTIEIAKSRANREFVMRALERFHTFTGWRVKCIRHGERQILKEFMAMDRMLVVVFDTEEEAYAGRRALAQLDGEGSIAVYADAVIMKNANGSITVKEQNDQWGLGMLAGTSLGALIGLLGGPVGLVIGASFGLLGGTIADARDAGIDVDFVDDASRELLPGKYALVAEISEDWTTPLDQSMEAVGGKVFRRALSEVKQTLHEADVAAMKADMAQMKAEQAKASADRKAKLQAKIDQLDAKIKGHLEKAEQQRTTAEREAKAKAELLNAKAATMQRHAAEIHV